MSPPHRDEVKRAPTRTQTDVLQPRELVSARHDKHRRHTHRRHRHQIDSRSDRVYRQTGTGPHNRSEGIKVIQTPIRAPQADAYAERFVRTVRAECLDWLLIIGRRHLEHVLRSYTIHYNHERPHRGLALLRPEPADETGPSTVDKLERRDRLGGPIHEYQRSAA